MRWTEHELSRNTVMANYLDGCEVSIPIAGADSVPVGLSLMAAGGRDERLLAVAARIDALLRQRADAVGQRRYQAKRDVVMAIENAVSAEEIRVDTDKMHISATAIEIVAMHKWYDEFHMLKDLNLKVVRGERIVICGPLGSGKSTGVFTSDGTETIPRE